MELVNHTPVPATLTLTSLPNTPNRRGYLTAKATFRIEDGSAVLDTQDPLPIFKDWIPHPFGQLPPDVSVMRRKLFEVMVLGEAIAPANEPTTHQVVTLSVGSVERSIDVFGDRHWVGNTISEVVPFTRMPLTWERAFGGSAQIDVGMGASFTVRHPWNARGRGFDLSPAASAYGKHLSMEDGFPRFDNDQPLPNLERPGANVALRSDEPVPTCWAPVPLDCGARLQPFMQSAREASAHEHPMPFTSEQQKELIRCNLRMAHPDWWIPMPDPGSTVRLDGMNEQVLEFAFPELTVLADYVVANRNGSLSLAPQMMIILSNEKRVTVTYRISFLMPYEQSAERGVRLRIE